MKNAVSILKSEHRSISAVLHGLQQLAKDAQSTKVRPDFKVFRAMLRYNNSTSYALAVSLGVAGGLLIGSRRLVHAVAMPYVVAAYGVPKILVLPWIALIFGLGTGTAVITATLFAVFPILLMVAAGTRDVDPTLITAAVSMGATRGQVSRKVLLPAVLPSVLAGMRIGVVFAMLGVLLAEMFAGTRGMGFLMQRMAMAFKASELFAATAVVSILSIVVVLSLEHLNQRLSRWR